MDSCKSCDGDIVRMFHSTIDYPSIDDRKYMSIFAELKINFIAHDIIISRRITQYIFDGWANHRERICRSEPKRHRDHGSVTYEITVLINFSESDHK
jgi:hypothetical protein